MDGKPVVLVLRGILRNDEGKYLLMQRSAKSKGWPGLWEFPGGKVNIGERHDQAFSREIKEETGFDSKPGRLLAEFDWEREKETVLYRIFWADNVSGTFVLSDEHDDFGWFSPQEAMRLAISPPLVPLVKNLI